MGSARSASFRVEMTTGHVKQEESLGPLSPWLCATLTDTTLGSPTRLSCSCPAQLLTSSRAGLALRLSRAGAGPRGTKHLTRKMTLGLCSVGLAREWRRLGVDGAHSLVRWWRGRSGAFGPSMK